MIPKLVTQLITILRERQVVNEVLGHALSLLSTLVSNHPLAVAECQGSRLKLRRLLSEKGELLKSADRPVSAMEAQTLLPQNESFTLVVSGVGVLSEVAIMQHSPQ